MAAKWQWIQVIYSEPLWVKRVGIMGMGVRGYLETAGPGGVRFWAGSPHMEQMSERAARAMARELPLSTRWTFPEELMLEQVKLWWQPMEGHAVPMIWPPQPDLILTPPPPPPGEEQDATA
jgi:hypothetical protein